MTRKKEIYFPKNKFVSYVCQQRIFFSKIYRDGSKNLFIIFVGIFEWQKLKYSNSNV